MTQSKVWPMIGMNRVFRVCSCRSNKRSSASVGIRNLIKASSFVRGRRSVKRHFIAASLVSSSRALPLPFDFASIPPTTEPQSMNNCSQILRSQVHHQLSARSPKTIKIFSRIWSGISVEGLRCKIVDGGRNTYEMRLAVNSSGGMRFKTSIKSCNSFDVGVMDVGVKREAPRSGTHTAFS